MRDDHEGLGPELEHLAAHYPAPEPDPAEIWRRIEGARAEGRLATSRRGRAAHPAWWAAAAAIALVVAGAMLVPAVRVTVAENLAEPVRSWGAERLTVLGAWLGAGADSVATDPGAARKPAVVDRVSMIPATVIELDIPQCQAGGWLTVQRHAAAHAVLETIERPGDAHLARSGTGFTIANTASSGSSYQLLVPQGVHQVWVHIGSRSILLPMRVADPAGWTLFLQSPDGPADAVGHCRP